MKEPINDTLKEIEDPVCRSRLEGLQESVYSIDQEIFIQKSILEQKQGMASGAELISKRILQECLVNNKLVDSNKMSPDEAKIRNDQIVKISEIIKSVAYENRNGVVLTRGQIQGLERAIQAIHKRFQDTALKFERHQRMQKEEEEEKKNQKESSEDKRDDVILDELIPTQGQPKKKRSKAKIKSKARDDDNT